MMSWIISKGDVWAWGHLPPKNFLGGAYFRANIMKNSDFLLIFHTYIFGLKCLSLKLTELLWLCPESKGHRENQRERVDGMLIFAKADFRVRVWCTHGWRSHGCHGYVPVIEIMSPATLCGAGVVTKPYFVKLAEFAILMTLNFV